VAHACNPSYLGGRDQEDHSSKPAWANSSQDPILKKHITKKGWWSGPEFKPQYCKINNNNNNNNKTPCLMATSDKSKNQFYTL
jgi:hypothetical protein